MEKHNRHKQYIEQHNRHKQYIEQHGSKIRKSANRAPGEVYHDICLTTEEKAWSEELLASLNKALLPRISPVNTVYTA